MQEMIIWGSSGRTVKGIASKEATAAERSLWLNLSVLGVFLLFTLTLPQQLLVTQARST